MIHIRRFDYNPDFQGAYYGGQDGGLKVKEGEPWLSWNSDDEEVKYDKTKLDPTTLPLTFRALGDNCDISINFSGPTDDYTRDIGYSINGGTYTWICLGDSGDEYEDRTISLDEGDTISFVGDNSSYYENDGGTSNEWIWRITTTSGPWEVYGNIMSLLYSTDFYDRLIVSNDAFRYLFSESIELVDASNLVLPALQLDSHCYSNMFHDCEDLIYPPKVLPSEYIDGYACYYNMFSQCRSLVKTPIIEARTIEARRCFWEMFAGCTSLVETQDSLFNSISSSLSSETCYKMFYGCSSLVAAPNLPSMTLAAYCYEEMFHNCSSLVVAPKLPATTLATYCYLNMFNGCTSLETAPLLPASSLSTSCYGYMFNGCTNLHYIDCRATGTIGTASTEGWVSGVSSSGLFIKINSNWNSGVSGIPTSWQVKGPLRIYIDDFPDELPELDGVDTWDEWFDYYYFGDDWWENSDCYVYTGESIEYNGGNYYLWQGISGNLGLHMEYLLTTTIDFQTLWNMSVENNWANRDDADSCPVYAYLREDLTTGQYVPMCNDYAFVLAAVRN